MNKDLLKRHRTVLIGAGAFLVGLLISQLLLDPAVPVDVFAVGLFQALPAALTAVSLVLVYRSVRIINWSAIAIGAIASQLFYELYVGRDVLPYFPSLFIGLLAGPLLGVIVGLIFSALFFRHPRLVLTVGTVLLTGLIGFIQGQLDTAFHPPGELRPPDRITGPWADKSWLLGDTPFRPIHLIHFLLLALLIGGLVMFFRRSRVGTAVRAAAENSDRASLLGINVKALQVGVWAIVGLIAGTGQIAQLAVVSYNAQSSFDFVALLLPLAAAVVARMNSMPIAFFTALGLSLMTTSLQYSASGIVALADIGILLVIMAGLLIQRNKIQTRVDESSSWKAVKEMRPTPREMLKLPAVRRTRRAIILLVGLFVLGIPWVVSIRTVSSLSDIPFFAMVALSLVILTGWSGQISLGQFALVAVGAFLAGHMTTKMDIGFWFAAPLAGIAGAAFAVLIGLPALRIRGLFLAVTTFSIAAVMPLLIFDPEFLGDSVPQQVQRPTLFFLDFVDERSMYYFMIAMLVLVVLGVQQLRKSRAGRVLIALRDNEAGAQSFGINIVRTRLSAFAISGFIASFAGALRVHQTTGMDRGDYQAFLSIAIFILVVVGGVSSITGAVLGAVYQSIGFSLFPGLQQLITGVLGLMVLVAIPGGLAQIVFGTRDAILRVIAMRQHIIVPSLFADYSPEAWEKRLVPLAPALQSQGIGALKPEQRYRLPSRIFGKAVV